MIKGQYLPVELNQTRLVSTARFLIKLIGQLLKPKNAWLMNYHKVHKNSPYGKIQTKREPITILGFTSRLLCHVIITTKLIVVSHQNFRNKFRHVGHIKWLKLWKINKRGYNALYIIYGMILRTWVKRNVLRYIQKTPTSNCLLILGKNTQNVVKCSLQFWKLGKSI